MCLHDWRKLTILDIILLLHNPSIQQHNMAKSTSPKKLLGIAMLATGAGLAFWGLQKSEGLQSRLSSAFTGSHTDNVMMLYIAAAVCLAIGAFLLIKK